MLKHFTMKKIILISLIGVSLFSCSQKQTKVNPSTQEIKKVMTKKDINTNLPTIGVLIFDGVIMNEVLAPLDVFSNTDKDNKTRFNVITIAEEDKLYKSAHGLKVQADYLIDDVPNLNVLVVPSSYTPSDQTSNKTLVDFVKTQNKTTDYMASHCAGAFLIGESGIADNKDIVTYVTGGEALKTEYPNLNVANDDEVSVMKDGKFFSSNGSLVSYLGSFDLLEEMTSLEHRKHVESAILFDRLK